MTVRALVVDDDPDVRCIAELALGRAGGLEVATAASGAEALAALAGDLPDVVVLDLRMPDMGGAEVLRAIRGRPELDGVAVILMTGDSPDDHGDVLALGAVGFVAKPFDPVRLPDRVLELVRAHASRRGGPDA